MTEIEDLPEGCIAAIVSRTTPVDAGRLSVVSKNFLSAADSDDVWNQFLPSGSQLMDSIISHTPSLANICTKKDLYLALSGRPIILNNGRKSFQLDRKSGKICYMFAARSLAIGWEDDDGCWKWTTLTDSRFPEVAELLVVCWLEICGVINTIALSPNTQYAAYVVFKMIHARGFQNRHVELSVVVEGGQSSTKIVCLDPNMKNRQGPSVRSDGWLEIEMGEFFNSGIENEKVRMYLIGTAGANWKRCLILEGIEVRPK